MSLLMRRRMLIAQVESLTLLPKEYQQVEYIESTGTQYIDTGVKPNNNTAIDIVFASANITGSQYVCGARKSTSNSTVEFAIGGASADTLWSVYTGGNQKKSTFSRVNNEKVRVEIGAYTNMRRQITFTNLTTNDGNSEEVGGIISSNLTMLLFGYNYSSINYGKAKIYECRLYDGDELIRDFVPCYRKEDKEDNVIGMYDKIEKRFYENAGTGTFIKGDEV